MASGRPDWYSSMAMHGKHGDDYIVVAVDAAGNILGIMQGYDGADFQPIAVDADGIMKANLALQDLSEMTVRTRPGAAKSFHTSINCPAAGITTVKLIEGKGMIYSGYMWIRNEHPHYTDTPFLEIDGQSMGLMNWANYPVRGIRSPGLYSLYGIYYDEVNGTYGVGITPGITFEESLELKYQNADPLDGVIVYYGIGYAEIV